MLPIALVLAFPQATPEQVEFFEKKIRPVLVERCYTCHSAQAKKLKGNLHLDTREGVLKGGDMGPSLVPGDPEKSLLIKAIRYKDEELQMPPKERLPAEVVADFEAWVKMGAPDPRAAKAAASADASTAARHWAFQPPKEPPVPAVKKKDWVKTPADAFVLAELEKRGMKPAPPADRRTLLRRATFDLVGLPPTAEELDAFEKDPSPDAFARAVDRLLASPQYGERWGRHWLDVARYSDTKGYVFREERRFPFSYTYRDWVVRAFNEDLPYDRFLVTQIAADRIVKEDKRDLAAMGFLTLGRRFLNRLPDIIDDRIDVLTRGTMGLTVSCARCHDHKYDPIPTKDYYALYGVFASSPEQKDPPLIAPPKKTEANVAYEKELQAREKAVSDFRAKKLAEYLASFRKPKAIADYLVAAHESRGIKDGEEPLRDFARKRELSAYGIQRWRNTLAKPRADLFGAWKAYAAAPEKDLAGAPLPEKLHPLVREAFAKPPATLREAAERYGALLSRTDLPAEFKPILEGTDSPFNIPAGEIDKLFNRADRDGLRALERKIEELRVGHPGAPQHAHALEDASSPTSPRVFVRGNEGNPGEPVPRRFLTLFGGQVFKEGSGRLELARAIASPDNPLTARVFVNRVWHHHFGAGLVRTTSDFGVRSDAPTHPELLDWLARRFVADGWSVKKLHRLVMLSSVYQLSSLENPTYRELDPENRYLARASRRRLEFEAMRDALLVASGRIDLEMGGRPVMHVSNPTVKSRMDAETIVNERGGDPTQDVFARRRSLYLFIDRQNLPNMFRDFDFASPDTHSPRRYQTTVPQQALFLMNSPFVVEQARHLAARAGGDVQKLYRFALGRAPTREEAAASRRFVEVEQGARPLAAAASPWQYGYGTPEKFLPLPHFTGQAWQGGPGLPDPKLGWVILNAQGGHAGNDASHAAIRRWKAPRDGTVTVSGTLAHKAAEGDGVRGRIVLSSQGELASWSVHNNEAETAMARIEVRAGDTIDFLVDCRKEVSHDGFLWAPVVRLQGPPAATGGAPSGEWSAADQFGGPPGKPGAALGPWEKLAQVLLLTNEFMFVD